MKIGTDIIQTKRIKASLEKFGTKFLLKFLNNEEMHLAGKVETIAGLWAAKEAIAKALGCGIGEDLTFHDILLSKDTRGAPSFTLSPKAQQKHQIYKCSLSISHDGGFAIAVAVILPYET
jgi:holo-[acyl-carrier protein] synthase